MLEALLNYLLSHSLFILLAFLLLQTITYRRKTLSGLLNFIFSITLSTAFLHHFLKAEELQNHRAAICLLNYSIELVFKPLSIPFALLLAIIFPLVSLYSIGYMLYYEEKFTLRYYLFLSLSLFSGFLLLAADNVILLIASVELLVFSLFVAMIYRLDESEMKASFTFLLLSFITIKAMVVALSILIHSTGSLSFIDNMKLLEAIVSESPHFAALLLTLFVLPFFMKLALIPFHFWIVDAYAEAPSPISTILASIITMIGAYELLALSAYMINSALVRSVFSTTLIFLGIISILLGSFRTLNLEDYKRIVAYSSIEHAGYIAIALGVGILAYGISTIASTLALISMLLHTFSHGIAKALLSLNVGSLEQASARNLHYTGTAPQSTFFFALLGFSVLSGIPPSPIFFSKLLTSLSCIMISNIVPASYFALAAILTGSFISTVGYSKYIIKTYLLGKSSEKLYALTPQLTLIALKIFFISYSYIHIFYAPLTILFKLPPFAEVFSIIINPAVILPKGLPAALFLSLAIILATSFPFVLVTTYVKVVKRKERLPLLQDILIHHPLSRRLKLNRMYETINLVLAKLEPTKVAYRLSHGKLYEKYLEKVYELLSNAVFKFSSIGRKTMAGDLSVYLSTILVFIAILLTLALFL